MGRPTRGTDDAQGHVPVRQGLGLEVGIDWDDIRRQRVGMTAYE